MSGSCVAGNLIPMTVLAVPSELTGVIDAEWRALATPGTWWTGEQRVALAATARARSTHEAQPSLGSLPFEAAEAARRIAVDVHAITREWVEEIERRGISRLAYAEILGVVARLIAVDSFAYGIGAPLRPLPTPIEGRPREETNPNATDNGAWIPTEGRPGATSSLTSVPAESKQRWDLSRALYLDDRHVGDWDASTELERPQMELVASRVSLLNECFY